MKSEYFNKITKLLKQTHPDLVATHKLEFKNVFGAVGGYVNGKIFISCGKFGTALKLPEKILVELFMEKDVKHLKYFPKGHVKEEYAMLSKQILENKYELKKLVDESIKYVLSQLGLEIIMKKREENKKRCHWPGDNPLMIEYHDTEWGVPVHDDQKLFEFIILEGAQAGLSWQTVLNKRENYREALNSFDIYKIALYDEKDAKHLLDNPGIIRNRLKIAATIQNAKKFLEIQKEFGSFDKYIWQFVSNKPIQNKFKSLSEIPPTTKESDAVSKALQKREFKFVGSTICYAFMEAVGMTNDHTTDCFRYNEVRLKY